MTKGFDQQDRSANFSFLKSVPAAQHGKSSDKVVSKPQEPRSFKPRPGH